MEAWINEQVALLQDGLPLLLLSWAQSGPALWKFLLANSQAVNHLSLVAIGVIGIPLLFIRTPAADRQAKTAEQGHITDRFTKAVEQLISGELVVRLGAIYALERISKDSPRDHWTIMEVLTAYVRVKAAWPPRHAEEGGGPPEAEIRPADDIQAILTVLGRRDKEARERDKAAGRRLNLSQTDLRGSRLVEANLQRASLSGANLQRAHLIEAKLQDAVLSEATLQHAVLLGAELQNAVFVNADLQYAILNGANLQRASLLPGQLDLAYGDKRTKIRGCLTRPARWLGGGEEG